MLPIDGLSRDKDFNFKPYLIFNLLNNKLLNSYRKSYARYT